VVASNAIKNKMRNRETFGNTIFRDPTASQAVQYVSIGEKRLVRKQLNQSRDFPDNVKPETNSTNIYSARNEVTTKYPAILKTVDPQTARVTEIRKQLESLWAQKKNGEISPKEYRKQQQELASELHHTERQRGQKATRTKSSI